MKIPTGHPSDRSNGITHLALSFFFALVLPGGTVPSAHAQGEIASGTISSSGNGPFTYNLSFSDAANATSPIGSVWYAWVPDFFYLPGPPISASVPAGWMANISGHSIQFVADSAAYDIRPGESLSGFSYVANFSPAQLRAAPGSGTSYAYSGGLHSDVGETFLVQTVPEPSMRLLLFSGGMGWLWICRGKLRSTTNLAGKICMKLGTTEPHIMMIEIKQL